MGRNIEGSYQDRTRKPSVPATGAGISDATTKVWSRSVDGNLITTTLILDMDGLHGSATTAQIIGNDGATTGSYLCQISSAFGTIFSVSVTCAEAPVGSTTSLRLDTSSVGTGKTDDLVTDLTDHATVLAATSMTINAIAYATTLPAQDSYLYLSNGDGTGADADYSAGKLIITIKGTR